MPRPRGSEYVKDVVQRTRPRGDYVEDFDDLEEEPEFDEEQPPRRRAIQKSKGRRVEESEEEEEEEQEEQEEEDDRRGKQLAVRQGKTKSQSKGKEVVRRKKHDTTEEEDSSDESEKELKKKAKKKTKARKQEVITKKAWEPVPRDEVDRNFIKLVANELGQNPEKILEGIEDDMLQRHTETGEYNIDAFFDTGFFSKKDQKIWKRCVEKLKGNKQKSQILFCSATTEVNVAFLFSHQWELHFFGDFTSFLKSISAQTYNNHPDQFNRNINKYFNLYIAVIDYNYGSFDRSSAGKKTTPLPSTTATYSSVSNQTSYVTTPAESIYVTSIVPSNTTTSFGNSTTTVIATPETSSISLTFTKIAGETTSVTSQFVSTATTTCTVRNAVPTVVLARPTAIMGSPTSAPQFIDDTFTSIDLPFPMQMGSNPSTRIFVTSNAVLSLFSGSSIFSNTPLPAPYMPASSAFGFWDDTVISQGRPQGVF
ncbi:MAG: hypothetical protein LQ348_005748 [Seirophora lacunosa]|nr:MAG: hypothetical protein LQ348_005748 [Seirophora lacunosa]